MHYIHLIAALAVCQFLFFGFMAGMARRKSGLKAPAVTGNEIFERMYRVQMNTLEILVAFLPALFLAGHYWPNALVSILGIIYITGRFIYWKAYTTEPASRGLGFKLSMIPTALLVSLAIVGSVLSIVGVGA